MAKFWGAPFREQIFTPTGQISRQWQKWFESLRLNIEDHELTHLYRVNDEIDRPDLPGVWEPFTENEELDKVEEKSTDPLISLLNEIHHQDQPKDPMIDAAVRPIEESDGFLPGMIVLWSGAITNIPGGWGLCDGSNSTPDLRNKFVLGAGTTAVDTEGANSLSNVESLTILETNLPAHTHSISSDGGHIGHSSSAAGATSGTDVEFPDAENATLGRHDHGGATGSNGDGTAIDVSPPYYALAYIMKL